jgi:hypothetical protein
MNRNLVRSIFGNSSIKFAYFVPIRKQIWPPQAILVSDWLISKIFLLLTDRDKISNGYRAPSIYVSYQVSFHLAKQFQRRRILEINQPETRIAYPLSL